jgi:hypothetical protein
MVVDHVLPKLPDLRRLRLGDGQLAGLDLGMPS